MLCPCAYYHADADMILAIRLIYGTHHITSAPETES